MGILSSSERTLLFSINSLRKYVEDEERAYVKILKEWKKVFSSNSDLNDPEMLAGTLVTYLMMHDVELRGKMWDLWRDDDLRIYKFYVIIAKHFVDCEAKS